MEDTLNWWLVKYDKQLSDYSCIVIPDGVREIKEDRKMLNRLNRAPSDEGHPEGGGAVWVYNSNTQRNGGQSMVGNSNGAAAMAGGAALAGQAASAGTCLTSD